MLLQKRVGSFDKIRFYVYKYIFVSGKGLDDPTFAGSNSSESVPPADSCGGEKVVSHLVKTCVKS